LSSSTRRNPRLYVAAIATARASNSSVLRAEFPDSLRARHASAAGTSITVSPLVTSC
jgi:hypothetical protein